MFIARALTRIELFAVAAFCLVVLSASFASNHATAEDYADRIQVMKSLGGAMKALGSAVANGNTASAEKAAKKISTTASEIIGLFKGGEPGTSRSKPEIWTNFADFAAKSYAMKVAADAVAADAAAGKLSSDPRAVVGKIGATCGGCHKVYRRPKV